MCVLYACISDIPSLDTFKDNQYMNDDGNGYAWIDKNRVRWRKGIKTAEDLYMAIRNLPLPIIVHQRMCSAGSTDLGLSHPFPINRNASTALHGVAQEVVAHNGTITYWKEYMDILKSKFGLKVRKDEHWSDTRMLAWCLANMERESVLKILGEYQKIAILDTQGIRITNEKSWYKNPKETGGYWQSANYAWTNSSSSYLFRGSRSGKVGRWGWNDDQWNEYFERTYGDKKESTSLVTSKHMGDVI